jgi:hypothetical protein
MQPTTATRTLAIALLLCLLALGAAPHVHAVDAGNGTPDCSLCASGSNAQAAVRVEVPPVVPLRHVRCALAVPAPLILAPRRGILVRGPPAVAPG